VSDCVFSQNKKKAVKFYTEGNNFFKVGDFESAINFYLKSYKVDPNFCSAIFKLGLSYKKINKLGDFKKWFLRYTNLKCSENIDEVNYNLGEFFFMSGEILKSKEFFLQVEDTLKYISYPKYLNHINYNLYKDLPDLISYDYKSAISDSYLQYSPQYDVISEELYYTKRKGNNLFDDEDISSFSVIDNTILLNSSVSFLNTENNEGSPTISDNGRLLIYTSCEMNFKKNSCDLYYLEKRGNSWTEPMKMSENINSDYWDSQPFLYGDMLFFVSNRPGGTGGRDIYFTKKSGGEWANAVNYEEVNSSYEEVSPFIREGILYFSSNRINSFGGFDLFLLDGLESKNKIVLNLGSSINSHLDESSIYLTDDLIFYTSEDKLNQNIKSQIIVGRLSKKYQSKNEYTVVEAFDLISSKELSGNILARNSSLEINFKTSTPIDNNYLKNSFAVLDADGYIPKVISLDERDTISIYLTPFKDNIILENIYFDFDNYILNDLSKKYIEVIFDWLIDNQIKQILISGHTDNIGTQEYNKILSEKRAKSVYEYLVSLSNKKLKISYRGYGSSKPLKVGYDGPKNRRIEFTIIH
tara:strand:- start:4141 stop:5889 length:1749 start_codon:yes stop_codon:yes gene_type:complete